MYRQVCVCACLRGVIYREVCMFTGCDVQGAVCVHVYRV